MPCFDWSYEPHLHPSLATFETRRSVVDLCTSEYDLQIAVVENSLSPNPAVEESASISRNVVINTASI